MPHTPGPWLAEGERVFSETPYTQYVATIHVCGDSSRATLDANARLIAAAPKLKDMTEKLAILAEALEGGEAAGIFDWLKIRDQARAVIAEATDADPAALLAEAGEQRRELGREIVEKQS